MKSSILFSSLILFVLAFASSCKEDIDLVGDAQETAVIYGLLNRADTLHFVKINRAFLSNDNSLVTAQIPDSNYFASVQATVKELVNGAVTRTWILKDTIVDNKEPGIFFAPEQKLYYFKTTGAAPLVADANTEYTLDVNINEGEFVVSGKTALVGGMSITAPSNNGSFSFANPLSSQIKYTNTLISFNKGTSHVADVSLRVEFFEFIGNDSTARSFDWRIANLGPSELTTNTYTVSANGNTFYTLMKEKVTNNPAITRRKLKSISVILTGGSEDLQKYISVNTPSSSLAQNKPTFTNLTASNNRRVVGLFSSRNTTTMVKRDWVPASFMVALNVNSFRELAQGPITGSLLFCTDNPNYNPSGPNGQTFYCN